MKEGLSPAKIDQLLSKIRPRPVIAAVDDDPVSLDLIERVLGKEYEIHRFSRAESFLEKFFQIQPDAIIMESVLPGMGAISVLEALQPKALDGGAPVLILSAKEDPRAKLLAYRRGASDYLVKPFDTDELAAHVKVLVRSKILKDFLKLSAISDPVSSLYNERFLRSWLRHEIERTKRHKIPLSCILMEWDGGEETQCRAVDAAWDGILRETSQEIQKKVRATDVIGRLDQGSFVLLLPGASKEHAGAVAQRLRESLGRPRVKGLSDTPNPTLSMGIVQYDAGQTPDPSAFLELAQEALAKAQSVGVAQTAIL